MMTDALTPTEHIPIKSRDSAAGEETQKWRVNENAPSGGPMDGRNLPSRLEGTPFDSHVNNTRKRVDRPS